MKFFLHPPLPPTPFTFSYRSNPTKCLDCHDYGENFCNFCTAIFEICSLRFDTIALVLLLVSFISFLSPMRYPLPYSLMTASRLYLNVRTHSFISSSMRYMRFLTTYLLLATIMSAHTFFAFAHTISVWRQSASHCECEIKERENETFGKCNLLEKDNQHTLCEKRWKYFP